MNNASEAVKNIDINKVIEALEAGESHAERAASEKGIDNETQQTLAVLMGVFGGLAVALRAGMESEDG